MAKKHFIFDMDNTICESRQKITPSMKKRLLRLGKIIVISGASREQMEYQLDGMNCTILAQSGNDTPLWKNKLSEKEKEEIWNHITSIPTSFDYAWVQDRGCQLSLSLTGHEANLNKKKRFDPKQKKRKNLLEMWPFKSENLMVSIAGTTCFDYTRKEGTKGKNISRWIKHKRLSKRECIYFGDALFKGGNDETVIGVIDTEIVTNPKDLLIKIKKYERK